MCVHDLYFVEPGLTKDYKSALLISMPAHAHSLSTFDRPHFTKTINTTFFVVFVVALIKMGSKI